MLYFFISSALTVDFNMLLNHFTIYRKIATNVFLIPIQNGLKFLNILNLNSLLNVIQLEVGKEQLLNKN